MNEIQGKLSKSPYNANFDPSKNYAHIAFKAGNAVQASEMNDFQLAFHNQIKTFAGHIFKNGSVISGGASRLVKTDYVTINEDFNLLLLGEDIKVVGETSSVEAVFLHGINRTESDPATFYVKYTKTGSDGKTNKFLHGEELLLVDSNNITIGRVTVRCPSCANSTDIWRNLEPIGHGYFYYVSEGDIYFEGYFITFDNQSVMVSKYDIPRNVKVGFEFRNSIITHNEDVTLYDNSLGYPNRGAVGADRVQLSLELKVYPLGEGNGDKFILMMNIDKFGAISYIKDKAEYADLMSTFAQRTYEINGNFTINPTKLSFLNEKKDYPNDPSGYDMEGSESKLIAVTTPFTAYVKGYRHSTISHTYTPFNKARETNKLNYTKRYEERAYILVNVVSDNAYPNGGKYNSFMDGSTLLFYDKAGAGNNVEGNVLGSCSVSDIILVKDNTYKLYLYDIDMDGDLSKAKCLANTSNQFVSNLIATEGSPTISNVNSNALIFPIEKSDIKSLRSNENSKNGSIIVGLRKVFKSTLDASGKVQFETIDNELFENIDNSTICYLETNGQRKTVKLDASNTTFTPQTLSINFGSGNGGSICTILQNVQRRNQKEKIKTLIPKSFMTDTAPDTTVGSKIKLGVADAYKIKKIELYLLKGNDNYELIEDVTELYKLNTNTTDFAYLESDVELVKNTTTEIGVDHRLQFEIEYFAHSGNEGYFTVDSYSDVFNDEQNSIKYSNLAKYKSPSSNIEYNLTQCIDFRPIIMSGERINATVPTMNATMLFDMEYYLPRVDILIINADGLIFVREGIASDDPVPPKLSSGDEMGLYYIYLNAYTYSLKDLNIKFIENRRYTMRDIGKIDAKVDRTIYYLLNEMERSLSDTNVKDADGFDRFKNGFFAESFGTFNIGDVKNREFRCAFDTKSFEMRPKFKSRNLSLEVNKALSTANINNGMAMAKYTSEMLIEQPYSTKSVSINPYMVTQRKGDLILLPNQDTWSDTNQMPDLTIDIDSGTQALKDLASNELFGTQWGDWEELNRTQAGSTSSSITGAVQNNGILGRSQSTQTTTTTNWNVNEQRKGQQMIVGEEQTEYDLGDVVKDVNILPFIREQTIQFIVKGLIPETVMYPYFDEIPVSENCRDIGYQIDGNNILTVSRLMNWGAPLVSDKNGELYGEFKIPEGRFKTGQREFMLTTNPKFDKEDDADLSWCFAKGEFSASGLSVDKQKITMNVTTPTVSFEDVTDNRVSRDMTTSTSTSTSRRDRADGSGSSDPLAQAFKLSESRFISGVSLYFHTVNVVDDHIWVQLRTMENGFPTKTILAEKKYYDLSKIPLSSNASAELKVDFGTPVYMEANKSYCFVVGGDSPNARIFVAKLGGTLNEFPDKILEDQPSMESSFRSKNGETWTAEQYEVIKFKLHACVFDVSEPITVTFNQKNIPNTLGENPIETELGKNKVRIYCDDHGFMVNDRFTLSLSNDRYVRVRVEGEPLSPQIGQPFETGSFKAVVADSKSVSGNDREFDIKFDKIDGVIKKDMSFTCKSILKKAVNAYAFTEFDVQKKSETTIPMVTGLLLTDFSDDYPLNQLNGIPISEFNKEHVVKGVDSINSFIIEVNTPANSTGRRGGVNSTVISNFNFKYDLFSVNGAYLSYGSKEDWVYNGLIYGMPNSKYEFNNNQRDKPLPFYPAQNTNLENTNKILSDINEVRILGNGEKSVAIQVTFKMDNPYLSPVMNIESFSMTTVSNKVGIFNSELMNVEPNADNRFIEEDTIMGGSTSYSYVTHDMRLKDPAMDVKVWLDVYKDVDADFDIYMKYVLESSSKSLDQVPWVKLNVDKSFNSPNRKDKKEYELLVSEVVDGWSDDIKFRSYKFKITGQTSNSAKPPIFSSFRGIAVT